MFRRSAKELADVKNLCVIGALIAVYVVMNLFLAYNTAGLKITFGYLALAAIGMLYGPVAAAIAAVPCDIITAAFAGLGISPWYILPKAAEGFIYGVFLYGYTKSAQASVTRQAGRAAWQVMRIVLSRFAVMALCYQLYNTYVNYYISGVTADAFDVYFNARLAKNAAQFPIDLALMFILLPALRAIYEKTVSHNNRRAL